MLCKASRLRSTLLATDPENSRTVDLHPSREPVERVEHPPAHEHLIRRLRKDVHPSQRLKHVLARRRVEAGFLRGRGDMNLVSRVKSFQHVLEPFPRDLGPVC